MIFRITAAVVRSRQGVESALLFTALLFIPFFSCCCGKCHGFDMWQREVCVLFTQKDSLMSHCNMTSVIKTYHTSLKMFIYIYK